MIRSFALVRGDTHYGPHTWDDEAGIVRGIHATELNEMGTVAWWFSPLGLGAPGPALHSNDGFIAMLLCLGFEQPAELTFDVVPADTTPADSIN